ncbi:bifunctional 2-polyprenyl-6-hydroxyphenol methylase/3-demethylubiquinol 3-O-methyltransferase UbiG [Acidipila sp. EB88]|uniref:class I SAM-dependent methyltransferase n=1 Tax=Acidipila sp. EB88 TaxID=2305226 RepID=UPI000F5DFEF9|nr:class I SAM-dependent methyltransferase [Acidipila sp. EB88]RRA47931.1 class I SAM-dependent methyltransferase [Acidipila sp. EB88]
MTDRVLPFYDALAEHYHLIFDDWDRSVERQAGILDALLAQALSRTRLRILDCACGIGTQALGLAARGHHVVASDLSPAQVSRAAREAAARQLDMRCYVSDMCDLSQVPDTGFDVVAAFDNALPHLSTAQLVQAVGAMAAKLRAGGLLAASIRDYDALLELKPAVQEPSFFGSEGNRRIVHQVWDWTARDRYTLHLYLTLQAAQAWSTHHFVSEYRCLQRQELSAALRLAGFQQVRWLMPLESGYYQPLVLARWP